jgi:hypothetical protein
MAAGSGELDVLIWLKDNGCPLTDLVCSYAAEHNRTEILEWLKENEVVIYNSYFGGENNIN